MTPSPNFYKLLVLFEGLKLKAYLDSASIPTIGIGTIKYPDGTKVKMGDVCTEEEAYDWAKIEAEQKAKTLSGLLINTPVSQPQFDSLLSLMYNIGAGAFAASTLLKRVKKQDTPERIREAFMLWNKAKVKGVLTVINGLSARRKKEADLFLS